MIAWKRDSSDNTEKMFDKTLREFIRERHLLEKGLGNAFGWKKVIHKEQQLKGGNSSMNREETIQEIINETEIDVKLAKACVFADSFGWPKDQLEVEVSPLGHFHIVFHPPLPSEDVQAEVYPATIASIRDTSDSLAGAQG